MVENKRCHRIKIKARLDQIKKTSDDVKSHDSSNIPNTQFSVSILWRPQEKGSLRRETAFQDLSNDILVERVRLTYVRPFIWTELPNLTIYRP